ncbi:iron ABC transporter substrate-binding protein [Candidimonas nitroreducens]|uniref:Iron ABC transporter substrate-binding protein n=1 Tax=Candidimonas nitroreducens TaxID=683354 RepID=A0A225M7M7_9BURK|nr:iron ABC transporter substrate-binding protein [Candidimonas nitroreducens]OWT56100.1 iron ABC transporter substrate-binding protein [Candidimonas nitroreducens]
MNILSSKFWAAASFSAAAIFGAQAGAQTLVMYNGQHKVTAKGAVQAFEKATGIKIELRNGSSSQLANLLIEEGAKTPADLFYAEETPPLAALAEKGLLSPIDPKTLALLPGDYHAKNGDWMATSARTRVVAYDKAKLKPSQLESSVLNYATAKWAGKIGFVPTSGAFQEQVVAIAKLKGRDAALAWLKGLKKYGKVYNKNMAALQGVERGEVEVSLINNYYWYALAKEKGAKNMHSALDYIGHKDPGALVTFSGIGVLKASKHQELAQKFVAWLASPEGQRNIVSDVAEYPVNHSIKSPFDLKPFSELDPPAVSPADLGDAHEATELIREAGLS